MLQNNIDLSIWRKAKGKYINFEANWIDITMAPIMQNNIVSNN